MNEDEKRAVVIIERGYVVHAPGGVKKTSAGETVFERDAISFKNRAFIEFGIRTDDPSAGSVITVFRISGKYCKLLNFNELFVNRHILDPAAVVKVSGIGMRISQEDFVAIRKRFTIFFPGRGNNFPTPGAVVSVWI